MPDASNQAIVPAASTEQVDTPHAYASLKGTAPAEETVDETVEGETADEGAKKPPRPIQPRINELVKKQREAERQADYWRGVAEGRIAPGSAPAAPAPAPAANAKPLKENFQNYDEYVEALTDWKADTRVKAALEDVNAKIENRESQQSAAQIQQNRAKNWQERSAATREILTDFDEVLSAAEGAVIDKHVAELLEDSPHGPALAYKLAKDPALLEKLNKLSVSAAAKEFGKMEAVFDGVPTTNAPAAAPASTASKAPKPPTARTGGGSSQKSMETASMDEYIQIRRQQGAFGGTRK